MCVCAGAPFTYSYISSLKEDTTQVDLILVCVFLFYFIRFRLFSRAFASDPPLVRTVSSLIGEVSFFFVSLSTLCATVRWKEFVSHRETHRQAFQV